MSKAGLGLGGRQAGLAGKPLDTKLSPSSWFTWICKLQQEKRHVSSFLTGCEGERVIFVPERSPWNFWAVVGKVFSCNPSARLWHLTHLW